MSSLKSDCNIKNVIAVGRLEFAKSFDILINSWRQLARKHPDWTLTIFGEGSKRNELQDLIDTYSFTKSIF